MTFTHTTSISSLSKGIPFTAERMLFMFFYFKKLKLTVQYSTMMPAFLQRTWHTFLCQAVQFFPQFLTNQWINIYILINTTIMTSDIWIDKISEMIRIRIWWFCHQNFRKELYQSYIDMRHTAIQLKARRSSNQNTSLISHLENKELKKQRLYQAGTRAVPQDRGRYFQVYIFPVPICNSHWIRLLAQTLPFPFTEFALV